MRKRQLIIVEGEESLLFDHLAQTSWAIFSPDNLTIENKNAQLFLFSHAKNALGRGFEHLIFDARKALSLEALSIACGTLQAGGSLLFWVKDWETFATQIDEDSQRWADNGKQPCPVFRKFFMDLVKEFNFPLIKLTSKTSLPKARNLSFSANPQGISNQDQLFNRLIQSNKNIVLTAKRGRGKSALAGRLATHWLQQNRKLIITAPNKKSLQTLATFCPFPLPFLAPDELLLRLKKGEQMGDLLLIDEAAQLPLTVLTELISYFPQIFCTTTIESYEGSGQGFALKFMQSLNDDWQKESLTTPLRWGENDPLEKWLDNLLLSSSLPAQNSCGEICFKSYSCQQMQNKQWTAPFYQLLSLAHYRTTPMDLRRLFDAPNQQFFLATQEKNLQGGIWAIEEGGMNDLDLIRSIQQGRRRPSGNLVAQLLSQMYLTPEACTLRSLRISRIAVTPQKQHQGLGKKLLQSFYLQQKNYDFISVSFGFTPQLYNFWHKNGFQLAYLTEHRGTTSGCYSAVALLPLTQKGESFCQSVCSVFRKNFALFQHPQREFLTDIKPKQLAKFSPLHQQMLEDFAFHHRSLFMTLPALNLWAEKTKLPPILLAAIHQPFQKHSRNSLKMLRDEMKNYLILSDNFD